MPSGGMGTVPSGGHHLPVTWEGGTLTFTANTKEELISRVEKFRMTNNMPIGNVSSEIDDYVARGRVPKPLAARSLRERVTSWKMNRMLKPVTFVYPVDANDRASICLACPFNKKDWSDNCASCVSHTVSDLQALRQNKDVQMSSELGACSFYGMCNKTSVWLDKESLPNRSQFPDGPNVPCWVHDLDKDAPPKS